MTGGCTDAGTDAQAAAAVAVAAAQPVVGVETTPPAPPKIEAIKGDDPAVEAGIADSADSADCPAVLVLLGPFPLRNPIAKLITSAIAGSARRPHETKPYPFCERTVMIKTDINPRMEC